jgi:F0F1-type ATP synthase epsilon subunit
VTILSDSAEFAADIDIARARAAKQRAEEAMRGEHDATVESALRRAQARLAASGGTNETLGAKH